MAKKARKKSTSKTKKKRAAPARKKRKAAAKRRAKPARKKAARKAKVRSKAKAKPKGVFAKIAGAAEAVLDTLTEAERLHHKMEPHVSREPE
jgi:hypothetical protein